MDRTEHLLAAWAARETGLLDAYLEHADTPAAAAAAADTTERAAAVVARALADLGVLDRTPDGYEPSNRALGLFTVRDPRSVGELPARLDRIDRLVDLPETMETGVPPVESDASDRRARSVGAREATADAVVRASVTAATRAAPDVTRVLSVADGAGTYAAEFTERGYEPAVADHPDVLDRTDDLLASRSVERVGGSLATLDDEFGLVFWADGPSRMDLDGVERTATAAHGALAADGRFVCVDTFAGDPDATAVDVRGLAAGHGGAHDADAVADRLRSAGFPDVRIEPVPGTGRRAVVARREGV